MAIKHQLRQKSHAIRNDIQGLRAIAVLVVVGYHAQVPCLTGGFIGVDLFFVLSGFLITGVLIRELMATGSISLPSFWARRIRRLLPAAMLVLLLTLAISNAVLPLMQRASVTRDIMWSALFSANWHFAFQQTDYLAATLAPSPVLHYWSLGVEEQFYLFWPVLLGLLFALSLIINRKLATQAESIQARGEHDYRIFRRVFSIAIFLVISGSFALCVYLTNTNQPFAYFGSASRIWQLAIGGLVAVWFSQPRNFNSYLQQSLGLAGLAAIAFGVFQFHESQIGAIGYPGFLALVPTFAAAALLIAGSNSSPKMVQKFLCVRPFLFIGKISYSWYLLHWPFLVLGHVILGRTSLDLNLFLLASSFLSAWALSVLVENPLRYSRFLVAHDGRSIALGASALIVILTLGVSSIAQTRSAYAGTSDVKSTSGKLVTLHPSPANAAQDYLSLSRVGCSLGLTEYVPNECKFGAQRFKKSVVLLGDSHASAIFPVVNSVAKDLHWKLNVWEKNACPIADVLKWDASRKRVFTECDQFREIALEQTIAAHPNLVILSSAYNPATILIHRKSGSVVPKQQVAQQFISGLQIVLSRLHRAGIPVLFLHEPPYAPFDPPNCLIQKKDIRKCIFTPPAVTPEVAAVHHSGIAKILDLTEGVCSPKICSPVKSKVLVYRDRTHMTKTYVMTLRSKFIDTLSRY
jgi:peptidoglycan/LPS O-acetylase OafA/YrhL